MRLFLRINLFLSSLLALSLVSCSPTSGYKFIRTVIVTEQDVHPIVNKNNALLYKAKIDIFKRHFSGLIVLKQIDDSTSHLTFVTEIGMKIFDYEIKNNSFDLVYIFEPLKNPKIYTLLTEDMKLILLQHLLNKEAKLYQRKEKKIYKINGSSRYYYELTDRSTNINKIMKKGSLITKVHYFYADSLNATKIKLKHKGLIRLKIELNTITKTTAS